MKKCFFQSDLIYRKTANGFQKAMNLTNTNAKFTLLKIALVVSELTYRECIKFSNWWQLFGFKYSFQYTAKTKTQIFLNAENQIPTAEQESYFVIIRGFLLFKTGSLYAIPGIWLA